MRLPYLPYYVDDYEASTAHLTVTEDGAYTRLLRLCWRTNGCTIPADLTWVFRHMRAHSPEDRRAIKAVLGDYFEQEGGRYFNRRLSQIYEDSRLRYESRARAGSKGGKSKALKTKDSASSNATALLKQPQPDPEPEPNINEIAQDRETKQRPCIDDLRSNWAEKEPTLGDLFEQFLEMHPKAQLDDQTEILAWEQFQVVAAELVRLKASPTLLVEGADKYFGKVSSYSSDEYKISARNFLLDGAKLREFVHPDLPDLGSLPDNVTRLWGPTADARPNQSKPLDVSQERLRSIQRKAAKIKETGHFEGNPPTEAEISLMLEHCMLTESQLECAGVAR